MKIDWNKKYNTIAIYSLVVVFVSVLFVYFTFNFSDIRIIYRKILSILKPFLIAGFIAYILNFLMEIFENLLFKLKYFQNEKKKKIARLISIFVTYSIFIMLIVILVNNIIPHIYYSIYDIRRPYRGCKFFRICRSRRYAFKRREQSVRLAAYIRGMRYRCRLAFGTVRLFARTGRAYFAFGFFIYLSSHVRDTSMPSAGASFRANNRLLYFLSFIMFSFDIYDIT